MENGPHRRPSSPTDEITVVMLCVCSPYWLAWDNSIRRGTVYLGRRSGVADRGRCHCLVWGSTVSSSASELMDLQADPEFVDQIREIAISVSGVAEVETLWVRKSGLEYFADIHIEVAQNLTVAEGHHIGHQVKDRLLAEFPKVRDVLVHLEPFPHIHNTK